MVLASFFSGWHFSLFPVLKPFTHSASLPKSVASIHLAPGICNEINSFGVSSLLASLEGGPHVTNVFQQSRFYLWCEHLPNTRVGSRCGVPPQNKKWWMFISYSYSEVGLSIALWLHACQDTSSFCIYRSPWEANSISLSMHLCFPNKQELTMFVNFL